MDFGLTGRVAIVCASSAGLGYAAAAAFLREGAHAVICSRGKERIESAARSLERDAAAHGATVLPVQADMTQAADITRLVDTAVERFGRIDVLVTNAGGPPVATFPELDDGTWEKGFTLTLMSVVRLIREVVPHMQQRRWGRIVNITSISARQPVDDLVISSTLRPGVVGLAKVLSNQYAKDGILVNNVAPGYMMTARQKEISKSRAEKLGISREEYMRQMTKDIPLQRYGEPDELAQVILFLCSERTGYVTGTTIAVDGGLSKGLL